MRLILGGYTRDDNGGGVAVADTEPARVTHRLNIHHPSYVAVTDDGNRVYAVSEDRPGSVHAFDVGPDGLRPIGEPRSSGGDSPCHLSVHPAGRHLLVANYGSGTVTVLPRTPDGELRDPSDVVTLTGAGPVTDRQGGPHAHQVVSDPGGGWVLTVNLGGDEVSVFALDAADGKLRQHSQTRMSPGLGPRHLAFAPDGRTAYVATELSSQLVACDWDAAAGRLTPRAAIDTVPPGTTGNYPAAVIVAGDGGRVYVTNRGHDSIAVVDTAAFELLATVSCEGSWPRDAALTPDGSTMYVACERSDAVVPFDIVDGMPQRSIAAPVIHPAPTCVVPT